MSHEIFRTLPARSALVAASLLLGSLSVAHGDVTVTKDDGEAAATKKPGGSVVTYRNTIANAAGGVTATGVEFKDPDVANTTYVAGSLQATPVAIDDSYSATVIANSRIDTATSGFSVVANDFPGYLNGAPVAASALTITNVGTPAHGTVSMTTSGAGVGRFIYTPTPGYTGADSFTYTISNTVPNGTAASITGTVNLTVGGPVIWFVNPAAASNGDGTLHSPFNNLASAVSAIGSSTNQRVFLFTGGAAQTTGITLNAGGWLVGQGATGASFDALMGTSYPADTVTARPAINLPSKPVLSRASGGDTVTLANNFFIAGVDITNSGGGFAVAGGNTVNAGTIGDATTPDVVIGASGSSSGAFSLNGGNGVIAVNAPLTASAGRPVQVLNRTGSTVTFSRAISGTGTGVSLVSNGGATISFTGGLGLSTGANPAFAATGGGTVTATQDNSAIINAITTTTGTALEVDGTTIGAAGLTFRSISANGASNGIRLNGTGTGGLTITGNSLANSGGTLQNLSGDGIQLTNASNVSLTDMSINSVAGSWIDATTVTGLTLNRVSANLSTDHGFKASTLTNLSITGGTFDRGGAGNGLANFNGFDITNLLGTSTVTGSTFRRSNTIQFRVRNTTATNFGGVPDTLTVSGTNWNTHDNAFAGDHLSVDAGTGGNFRLVMNATSGLNTVNEGGGPSTGGGTGVQATSSGTNGKMDVSVTGLKTTSNTAGVVLGQTGSGALTYNISGNSGVNGGFNATGTCAIIVTHASAGGTSAGTINGNSITHTAGPGVNALQVVCEGSGATGGTATTVITNNTISGNFQRGIQLQARVANSALNATVSSNTLNGTDTTNTGLQVVNVETGGSGSGHTNTVRLNLQSNTVTFGPSATYTAAYRLVNRTGCTFQLHNFSGNGAVAGDVQAWVTTAKGNSGTPVTVSPTAAFSSTSSVPQPLMFMPVAEPVPMPEIETAAAPTVEEAIAEAPAGTAETTTSKPADAVAPAMAMRQEELDALVAEAIARWTATGLTEAQIARLKEIRFQVSDLPGSQLGQMGGDAIEVNRHAAGHDWHVDSAPHDDHEFCGGNSPTRLDGAGGDAADRVDLLTTLMHEMGHALGLPDLYQSKDRDNIMFGLLPKGERRLPAKDQAKDAVPFEGNASHPLSGGLNPIQIGNLPPGKSVIITYQVQIDDPFALGATQISSQATVSGSNFADVLSDDPNTGAPADATVTLLDRPDTAVVSLDRSTADPTNAGSVNWTLTLSQPAVGLTSANFSLINTGLGGTPAITAVTSTGGSPSATWQITASTGSGDGTLGLNLANDTSLSHDVTNAPFTGQVYTLDRSAPTVVLASAAANPTNVSPIPVTVTFNESVTGFTAADITPGNATVANFAGSGSSYTFDLVPAGQGSVTADIAAGVAQDAATNGNTAAVQFSRNYDSVLPTVAMTSASGNPVANAAIPVSVTFSESVSGFTDADITAGSATVANFAGSDASYTFDLVPSGPGVTATADIAAGVAQDAAGNDNTAATQFSRIIVDEVSIAATTATAVEGGATGVYTLTRGASSGDVTVNFQLDASSTAVAGTDFTLSSAQALSFNDGSGVGTLVIPDGSLTATITLTATAESPNAAEIAETATLNVTSGTGYAAASAPGDSATVTINQNGLVVVNTNDSGEGSLRQAILNANALGGDPVITFDTTLPGSPFAAATAASPAVVTLTSGQLAISSGLTVQGLGAPVLHLSGNNSSRVIDIAPGSYDVTLAGLTIRNGSVTDSDGAGILCQSGGALVIESCSIQNHQMTDTGGTANYGAGLCRNGGTLLMEATTVSGNVATGGQGGGVAVDSSAAVLTNCTISGNSASQGGGLYVRSATVRLIHGTVTSNTVSGNGAGAFLSIFGRLDVGNSLVAGNAAPTEPDISATAPDSLVFSLGGNWLGINQGTSLTAGTPNVNGDWAGTSAAPLDPVIGSLADNGGPTATHALLAGSPAINAGNLAAVPADTTDLDGDSDVAELLPVDQRGIGFNRLIGPPDIGAFELQKSVFITADLASANEGTGAGTTDYTFTVTRTGDTSGPVTVGYAVAGSGGSPADAADFGGTLPSGQVTIADGNASALVTVPVSKDATRESDEEFQVTLSNPDNGYVVSGTPAVTTIANDDFEADLAITKTDGVTTATPGGSVTYTIMVSNAGPDPVIGATVADTFPASLTANWTAVGAGGGTATASGSGNISDTVNLPVGASVTYTVTATISPAATGSLSNTATVAAPAGLTDPDPANNSATDTDTLTPQADLAVTKTDGVTTAVPGGSVTYTITATNAGPSNVVGATVADTFPATLTATWTAVGAGGGTATASGSGNISDTVNLPVGASVTYTVTATISASATGSLTNTATVSSAVTDPNPANNSATDTDTLTPQADLTITKTDGATTAVPGTSVTYTITASNAGPSNAPGATVADTLPATLTGVTWTAVGAGGGTATAAGSGNISDTVNLPAGGSVTFTVTGTILPTATGSLSNTATVAAPAGVTDTNPANNSATDTDTLTPRANLSITKTDGVTTATPGGSVTYTITASNAGPSSVTGATVADTLPASLTATWTAVGAGGGTATASGSGNISDTVNLPVGASVTYTVSAMIDPSAAGSLSNTATVSAPAGVTDPDPADNSATDTDSLIAQADLAITKTDGVITAIPGGSVTYTITASNAGPSNASAVTVSDVLPLSISGATWTGVGAGGGTGPASGSGNISASNISLPAGGSFTFTVTAPVSAAATGTLVNTATVSSAVTDPNPANNSATDTDTLTPQADLSITKTDGVTSAVPGTPVTYTITVSNPGPSNAPGAMVADTPPAILTGVTWTAVGAGGGTVTAAGSGNINETVNLPAGGSVTFTTTGTISSAAIGSLTNTATVAAAAGVTDPNPANNSATDTDTLTPQANLALTMTDSPDPVNALGNLTYSLDLTNDGPSDSVSPLVTLPLPAGTTFVSATAPAGWTPSAPAVGASGTVTFTASSIATGATANFTVVTQVDINIVNDSILTATATASATTTDPTPGNNTATTTTVAKSGADLELTLTDSPDPVIAGTDLTYTIGLTNHGPLDSENVSITQTLPPGTTFVSLSTPADWSATTPAVGSAGAVTITRSSFANAANASFTLVVTVAPDVAAATVISGTATVNSTTVDIVPGNNSSTATTTVSTEADLGVTIVANPTTAPKGSDVTFSVGLSNQGPSDATSPMVSLPLPAHMTFVSAVAPAGWATNAPAVGATGTVQFSASSLATGASGDFTVIAKVNANAPTGTVLTATVTTGSSAGDTQMTNNTATATAAVGTLLPTAVQPVTTGITVNPQSGLYEVSVDVTNTTPNAINGFRLHVDYASYLAAYPSLRLYNASSPANAGEVYVDYPFPVAVDGVVTMKLSFYTSTRTFPSPFTPQLAVEILPSSQLPHTDGAGVQPRVVGFSNGNLLLEFPSVTGKWYRVRYSPDMVNWHDCPVPLQAGSTRMQWIDSGPPFTDVPPSQAPARYYRVNEIAAP